MFVCEPCLKERFTNAPAWSQSHGKCEVCDEYLICSDIPSFHLELRADFDPPSPEGDTMTLPDKLYVVRFRHFRPDVDENTPYGKVQAAETDCLHLNQEVTPRRWIGTSISEAAALAHEYYGRTLRAPGHVSAMLLSAAFNPHEDTVPEALFDSGRAVICSPRGKKG